MKWCVGFVAVCSVLAAVVGCGHGQEANRASATSTSSTGTSAASVPPAAPVASTSATPAASGLPAAAWIPAADVPLDDSQHWPDLATIAQPVTSQAFRAEEVCATAPTGNRLDGSMNGRALVENGPNAWSMQQQTINFPGDPWTMGQRAFEVFNAVAKALGNCGRAAVDLTTPKSHCDQPGGCSQLAATITHPTTKSTVHVYLAVAGATVTELSVWSEGTPPTPWPTPADAGVLAALVPPLCTAWQC